MKPLSFPEELWLLLHDETAGRLRPLAERTLNFGLAAAALIELSHQDRIDTDLEQLILLSSSPLGDPVIDPVLARVAAIEEPLAPETWVRRLGLLSGDEIQTAIVKRLYERGILERSTGEYFFLTPEVAHSRRYPGITVEGEEADEVRVRIMRILFSGDVPDPRDADLVGLTEACGIFNYILSISEREQVDERIQQVKSFNLLCYATAKVIMDERKPPQREYTPIPIETGLPVVGCAISMIGDLHAFLVKLHRQHGPVCEIRLPGRRVVVMGGREANKWMMRNAASHLRSCRPFAEFNHALKSDRTLVSLDGSEHVRLRRVAQSGYSKTVIERRIEDAIEIARQAVASWTPGTPLQTFETLQRMAVQQVAILATGYYSPEYHDDLKYYFDTLLSTVRKDMPGFINAYRLRLVRHRIRDVYQKVMEVHEPGLRKGCPRDLIDDFYATHREDPQFLSEKDLMSAVLGPYFGAMDTVAGILSFALLRLLAEPQYKEMLQAEADRVFANGMPDANDIRGMKVTHAFITEALRCYPVTPILVREVVNSFEFEGYYIPVRTNLMVASAVAHFDADAYTDPDKFEPERHLPPRSEYRQRGAFAPFGVGPHTCIGGEFAKVQIAANLATILHYAELEPVQKPSRGRYGIRIKSYPTIRPHKSCRFKVVRHVKHK